MGEKGNQTACEGRLWWRCRSVEGRHDDAMAQNTALKVIDRYYDSVGDGKIDWHRCFEKDIWEIDML